MKKKSLMVMVVLGILLLGGLLVGALACNGGEGSPEEELPGEELPLDWASPDIEINPQGITGETAKVKFQALVDEFNGQGIGIFHIQGTYYEYNYLAEGPAVFYLLELFYELDQDVVDQAEVLEAEGMKRESDDLLFENAFKKAHPLIGQVFMYTVQVLEPDAIRILTIFPENSIKAYETKPEAVEIIANTNNAANWDMYVKKYRGEIHIFFE